MARLLSKSLPNDKKQLLLNEIDTINSYNEIMDNGYDNGKEYIDNDID